MLGWGAASSWKGCDTSCRVPSPQTGWEAARKRPRQKVTALCISGVRPGAAMAQELCVRAGVARGSCTSPRLLRSSGATLTLHPGGVLHPRSLPPSPPVPVPPARPPLVLPAWPHGAGRLPRPTRLLFSHQQTAATSTSHHYTSSERQETQRLFVFTSTHLIDGLRKGRREGNFSPIKRRGIACVRLEVFVLQIPPGAPAAGVKPPAVPEPFINICSAPGAGEARGKPGTSEGARAGGSPLPLPNRAAAGRGRGWGGKKTLGLSLIHI